MPTVEKTSGGRVHVRGIGRFVVGDTADVSADEAAYLVEERGDFAIVDESDLESEWPVDQDGGGEAEDEPDLEDVDGESGPLPFNPEAHTNAEVEERVADIDDEATLVALRNLEADQKDRTGATDAIDDRRDELED